VIVIPTVTALLILAFLAKEDGASVFVGDLLQSLAFVLIGVTLIDLLLNLVHREKLREDVTQMFKIVEDTETTGIRRIFFPARDWTLKVKGCRKVIITGLRVRFVNEPGFIEHCDEILDHDGEVTLVMADPRSDAMRLRYREEPLPHPWGQDPQGETNALVGLANLLSIAYNWHQRREKEKRNVSKFVLKVASNYPSHAYYLLDDELYVYHYPFKARGFDGPLFQFASNSKGGDYLRACLERVVLEATTLSPAIYKDIDDKRKSGQLNDDQVFGGASAGGVAP
jgi:hypothetical protein